MSSVRKAPLAMLVVAAFASACAPFHAASRKERAEPRKIEEANTRVPQKGELPGLVGELQETRVAHGETLLDVARRVDLGYQQVQDANADVDQWVPQPGAKITLPSRWILPRSRYRGIVINLPEMRLYLFPEKTAPGEELEVRTWPIGIGMDDTPSPIRSFTIRTKETNPTWVVPDSILKTRDDPRRVIPPGPDNPLGAYRMRLSYDIYAIHGTDTPWAVGRLTTHGCIRLYPEDIPKLFDAVRIGTEGEILYQPVKIGEENDRIYVEVHGDVYDKFKDMGHHAATVVQKAGVADRVDAAKLRAAVAEKRGIPVDVTRD